MRQIHNADQDGRRQYHWEPVYRDRVAGPGDGRHVDGVGHVAGQRHLWYVFCDVSGARSSIGPIVFVMLLVLLCVIGRRRANDQCDGQRFADEHDRDEFGHGHGDAELRVGAVRTCPIEIVRPECDLNRMMIPLIRSLTGTSIWLGAGIYQVSYTPTTKGSACSLTIQVAHSLFSMSTL